MNYTKIYHQIIDGAKRRNILEGYFERHHIIPRSIGGSDDAENIVKLTAREHFISHLLLVKIYQNDPVKWHKMVKAFMMMAALSEKQERYTSRTYERLRKYFSKAMSISQAGKKNSQFGTKWICNVNLGQNKKIRAHEELPYGWEYGRLNSKGMVKQKDFMLVCGICQKQFNHYRKIKFCSSKCVNVNKSREWTTKRKFKFSKLEDFASTYSIKYGSVRLNDKFIKEASVYYNARDILQFLRCKDSGGNYSTIQNILST